MHDDGLAYVKNMDEDATDPPRLQMATGLADVSESLEAATIESAEECPGECIFIEIE
jgi:ferredoxin